MREQVVLVVKNPPANAGDVRDTGSIPELGGSLGGRHGNPLQHSCLENRMDREAWRATVPGVAQSKTRRRIDEDKRQRTTAHKGVFAMGA